jgi:hypothetical protein
MPPSGGCGEYVNEIIEERQGVSVSVAYRARSAMASPISLWASSGERSEGRCSHLRSALTSDSGGFKCHCQEAGCILALKRCRNKPALGGPGKGDLTPALTITVLVKLTAMAVRIIWNSRSWLRELINRRTSSGNAPTTFRA